MNGKGAEAMSQTIVDSAATIAPPKGNLRPLHSDVVERLPTWTVPTRCAYIATDGTPGIVPDLVHVHGKPILKLAWAW